jgi:hypothetical protein
MAEPGEPPALAGVGRFIEQPLPHPLAEAEQFELCRAVVHSAAVDLAIHSVAVALAIQPHRRAARTACHTAASLETTSNDNSGKALPPSPSRDRARRATARMPELYHLAQPIRATINRTAEGRGTPAIMEPDDERREFVEDFSCSGSRLLFQYRRL